MRSRFLGEGAWLSMLRCVGAGFVVLCAVSLAGLAAVAAPALALPEGRVYEMVSPPYKGGYGADVITDVALDGESMAFYSPGAFAEAPNSLIVGPDYIARRGSSGWSTTPLTVPATVMPYLFGYDLSPTLGSQLALGKPGANQEGAFQTSTEARVMLHSTDSLDTAANWELAGMVLKSFPEEVLTLRYLGASPDFCHIIVANQAGGGKGASYLLPEVAGATASQLYDLDRGCGGEPVSLRLVGLNNEHKVITSSCSVTVGGGLGLNGLGASEVNPVTDDGGEIFFTTCSDGPSTPYQLFVRLGGEKTLEVSKPLGECPNVATEIPCAGAAKRADGEFVGASEDGSVVFFTSTSPLVPGETDVSNNLYLATIGCPVADLAGCSISEKEVTSLTSVSRDPVPGEAAEVQGAVRVAPDGQRVYFVARGVLTSQPGPEDRKAVKGADNLYVYDIVSKQTGFIGDLCSGRELSGVVEDLRCPTQTGSDAQLWSELGTVEAQTAGADGGFLVFGTYAQLVAGDTDAARDVYRYDAETGALERVSIGEDGYDANGNNDLFDAAIVQGNRGLIAVEAEYELRSRAVSKDGSRIVFHTAEPLSPAAVNGLTNVYEWHIQPGWSEGRVSLISSGSAEEPVENAVIDPSGKNVFFVTSQGLVPQDTDGRDDVYDARLGGGFPPVPAPAEPCEGDACQGPLTNPAPLLVPGSVSQAPGQNFAAPAPAPAITPKKATPKCPKGKKLSHGRCVKARAAKRKTKARKAGYDRRYR